MLELALFLLVFGAVSCGSFTLIRRPGSRARHRPRVAARRLRRPLTARKRRAALPDLAAPA